MLQEIFRLPTPWGSVPIFGYGLMMVIGFLAAVQLAKFLAARSGLDPEVFVNGALIALIAGIAGARLSHILENLAQYTNPSRTAWDNFIDAINIRSGGLTFYGGLLLAFPLVVLYGIWKKVPIPRGMDIVAPAITLGLAFGRIGCFLNGCCHGAVCEAPWAVHFPYYSNPYIEQYEKGELTPPPQLLVQDRGRARLMTREELRDGRATVYTPDGQGSFIRERIDIPEASRQLASGEHSLYVHPAQLYSALTASLITALLVAFYTLAPAPGRVMALMLMVEGATRFLLELLRAEPPVLGRMSLSMILGILIVAGGALMWVLFGKVAARQAALAPAR